MELEDHGTESLFFDNLQLAQIRDEPLADNDPPVGDEVYLTDEANPIGPGLFLPVIPGDRVEMSVYGYYDGNSGFNSTLPVQNLTSSMTAMFNAVNAGTEIPLAVNSIVSDIFSSGLGAIGSRDEDDAPAAYLNYLMFDEGMNLLTGESGFVGIPDSANGTPQPLSVDYFVNSRGYLFMYLSNESNSSTSSNAVYWDDLKITHHESPIVQVDDYYPFGGVFNSYTLGTKNNYLFGEKELQEETQVYDFEARMYDPWLGRFNSIDPLTDLSRKWTPYAYSNDNPIRFNDPTGLYSTEEWKKDHGITDDDLINVYTASSSSDDDDSESNDQNAKPVTPAPKNVLGSIDYYQFRQSDFHKRYGKNKKAPTYYMSYGDKYAKRFSSDLYPKLSSQGQSWLTKTRYFLQILMEDGLANNPAMELDDNSFTDFAFNTHPEAYIQGGLLELGFEDKLEIVLTPDFQDLGSSRGGKQMRTIMKRQTEYYQDNPDVLLNHIKNAPHALVFYYKLIERVIPNNVIK